MLPRKLRKPAVSGSENGAGPAYNSEQGFSEAPSFALKNKIHMKMSFFNGVQLTHPMEIEISICICSETDGGMILARLTP